MAFKPSYNIMDRDTHNALVNAFKTGGIAYTDDDGTVHKIADDYINGGGGGSSLPSVTSADAGKVLAVNASGEWAAEQYAGYDAIIKVVEDNGSFLPTLIKGDQTTIHAKIAQFIPVNMGVFAVWDVFCAFCPCLLFNDDENVGVTYYRFDEEGLLGDAIFRGISWANDNTLTVFD